MKRIIVYAAFILTVSFVTSCFSLLKKGYHVEDPISENSSFIFGYLEPKGAPGRISRIHIKRIHDGKKYYYSADTDYRGLFWLQNVGKGTYQISGFTNAYNYFCCSFGTFNMGGSGNYYMNMQQYGSSEGTVKVEEPGIYYMGAYQFKKIAEETFTRAARYESIPAETPTVKELLGRLVDLSENTKINHEFKKAYENSSKERKK